MRRINVYLTIALLALLGAYIALLDTLAKPLFEQQATRMYGAEVSVDSLQISPFIGKITLHNLQVTDRRKATRNLARADRVYLDIDIINLAQNIIEIDELEIDGLVMLSKRSQPGLILRPLLPADSAITAARLPSFELPDTDALLATQRGKLLEETAQFKSALTDKRLKWKEKMARLPGASDIDAYKERVRELNSATGAAGKLAALAEAQKMYAQVNNDLKDLRSTQQEFRADVQLMRELVDSAAALPQKHVDELIRSLGLSSEQFAQLGSVLLRGDLSGITEQVLAPLAYNASGEVNTTDNMPIFVRHATINGSILPSAAGLSASGYLENFAWPLELAVLPAILKLEGSSPNGGLLRIDASVDHRSSPVDHFAVRMENLPLRKMALTGTKQLSVELEQTLANVSGEMNVDGNGLSGRFNQNLTATVFNTVLAENAGGAARLLAAFLDSSTEFAMQINFSGTLDAPQMRFSADLDKRIESALHAAISEGVQALTFELQNRISAEIGPEIAAARAEFSSLEELQAELEHSLQTLSGIAK